MSTLHQHGDLEGRVMDSSFYIWDADDPKDHQAWIDFWLSWPEREVSSHPGYVGLFKGQGDRIMCAAYKSRDGFVLYAFILREVRPSPIADTVLRDMTTPYGYGGPFVWGLTDVANVSKGFWSTFDEWAAANSVVTEFIRFALFPEKLLPYPGEVSCRSQNVVRSLQVDDDSLFKSFEAKVRKNVRKAVRHGLAVKIDEDGSYLADFMRIYESTMNRREATSGYYFPRKFFEAIKRNLPGQFAYLHVVLDENIVSTELVLLSHDTSYSFLGGTDSSYFDLRPNDLLKYEIIRWSRSKGLKHFVLGGGAAPNDGIERYKRSFAPSGNVDFLTGQRILMPQAYEQLVLRREAESSASDARDTDHAFFPAYRRPA
ncbi:GNAT family N-acetyltransferase [Arthrobacter sp. AB6]|uniref:GNAT family N-acetyltransferase n=1 Tax=Arthrobacter sp. AB6 TaxID=2962570 RepID=UPI0028810CC5|nr:GNAT family N-acetyltransferase [Arthrobacter sp. AB6]MDT0193797.1 GNAT family N-acetyltransferase [Arthrobacter sp. AB6]